jgi:basic membrane protein A
MKKARILSLAILALGIIALFGVGTAIAAKPKTPVRVALVLNGTLGDKSFFDSAARGIQVAEQRLPVQGRIIEAGYDPSKWEPALEDAVASDYDVIVVGTWQMVDYVQDMAIRYPEKKFVVFDTEDDYSQGKFSNVYCMTYKQNEGSYLAGLLAGHVTVSNMPMANKAKVVGVVGGQDIPVINDFIIGYKQGELSVDPGIQVLTQYVGNWNDAAKAKEIALAMISQGADVIYSVAAGAGVGIFEAAKEKKCYAIGVDSDQALLFEKSNPQMTQHILSSMTKNIDMSVYRALELYVNGKLQFGKTEMLGIKERGVGLAKNKYYQANVSEQIREAIDGAEKSIVSGGIRVDTVFK